MSSEVVQWVKIPNVGTHCVQSTATIAVEWYIKKTGISVKYVCICVGWYLEIDDIKVKYCLIIKVIDSEGKEIFLKAIVIDCNYSTGRVKEVVSVIPGYYDPVEQKFWNQITNLEEICVQNVAKFAVDEYKIEHGDSLSYICTYYGIYYEFDIYTIYFSLHLKMADCLGRECNYEALVCEAKPPASKRVWTLKSFKPVTK